MLFFSALLIAIPCQAFSSSEYYWTQKERENHGDLASMLNDVEKAEDMPQLRNTRSAPELIRVLIDSGRFKELGLTDEEGATLVHALYNKWDIETSKETGTPAIRETKKNEASENNDSAVLSFRAGQEFEELSAVLLRWPFDWSIMRDEWSQLVDALWHADVTVYIWVNAKYQKENALTYLAQQGVQTEHTRWVVESTNAVWIRDYGPQFLYDNNSDRWGLADFHYLDSRPLDDDTPAYIAERLGVPLLDRQTKNVVYQEGGNLNHDGLGCVVYSQRTYNHNIGVPPTEIDGRIKSAFQAHMNIVPQDPTLDMTGHVDMFMKIVNENTVLVAQYDSDEIDYQILEDCATLLENSTNGMGVPWNVVRIHQPDVYYIYYTFPVVRTYTNSLIANDVVLLPVYGYEYDQMAITIHEQLFPGKTIWPIDAASIIPYGGAWHCVMMEFPNPQN